MTDWTPRLVAVDADGTIVGPGDHVPPPIAEKLRQIDAQGIPVVLVTGRAWLSAQLVCDQLMIPHMYCVCNNGATVVTYPPLEVVADRRFDPALIIAAVRDHPSVMLGVEDFGRGYRVSQPFPPGIYDLHGEIRVVDLEDLAGDASRLIVRDLTSRPADFDALIAGIDLEGLYHSKGSDNWLDIGPGSAGKDNGLALVADRLGIAQGDTLAIGDSYNDVDLLSWAGRGVALGGAPEELVAVADDVTQTFAAGGTLAELGRWFP